MRTNCSRGILSMLAVMCAVGIVGVTDALAQRFQTVYGSRECIEAGRAGVAQYGTGGYVAAGESWFDSTGTCGRSHIYVIRTRTDGRPVWSNIYAIGAEDSALDIVVCDNGDLAVCGVVTDALDCNRGRDAFLMRLDSNGNVLAVHTYGTACSDEIAWNLVQARTGNDCFTHRGDLVVVGSTTWHAGLDASGRPLRDGYIFRTDANLNIIWGRHYGGQQSQDDYLYGVDEGQINIQPGPTGDIVATGGTNTWGAGRYDIWMLRVNGDDGTIGAAPQNAATYGGRDDDEGRAIIELRGNVTNIGELVVTGITFSRPFPSTNSEVAMLQTRNDPCRFVSDQFAGDNGPEPDGGMDLKEDAFPTVTNGDVIVTGFTSLGLPLVPQNAFLQRFFCSLMLTAGNGMTYGGDRIDWGWSVNNCTRVSANETQGYVVGGFTQSPNLIGADPQQLYLIKSDVNFDSDCNQDKFKFDTTHANFHVDCPRPENEALVYNCSPDVKNWRIDPWDRLCYALPQARDGGGSGNDGASGVEAMVTLTFTEGSVTSYPNPIMRGVPLNLRFTLAMAVRAMVSVTDVTGRIVYTESLPVNAGTELKTVATKGWASGSYLVRVAIGEKSMTTKIVLVE